MSSTDSSREVVRTEVRDGVATITIDRPEARNALSRAVLGALPRAVRACDDRDDVAVIVLTGTDPAFCAGLDLKELGAGLLSAEVSPDPVDGPEAGTDAGASDAPTRRSPVRRGPLPVVDTPIIGAVNGVAVTGGLELALACDLLVASDRARFADTHARIGVMPGWGLTVLLPEAIGRRRAREMSLTGNYVDAVTALEWGLVNHVVDHDDLLERCHELATEIASNDRSGVRRMLATYREGEDLDPAQRWELEARVARSWTAGGAVDPAEVERRRSEVVARGRSQVRPGG